MDFLTVREFRNSPKAVWNRLNREGRVVITNNGKPQALMIPVDASSLEEVLSDVSRLEAKRAVRELQKQSIINGTSTMTMDEIDAIIAQTRSMKQKAVC